MDGEILAAFPRPTPAFWPLWVAREKSARLCRARQWPRIGYRSEKSCLSSFLAFKEGSAAPVLPFGCRFARKERGHFPGTDFLVTGMSTFVIEEPFRTATSLSDGFEQVAPRSQSMIGRIKHSSANERTAHEPQEIGAFDDKGFDLNCHLATSSYSSHYCQIGILSTLFPYADQRENSS